MKKMSTKFICYTAMLVALSSVANIFTVIVGGGALAISFAYIPAFIGGAFLGPFSGFLVGILGDLIGCLIAPKGAINPIILLSSGLIGLIPGLVFMVGKKLNKNSKASLFLMSTISFVFVYIICITLNSYGLYLFYFAAKGRTFLGVLLLRIPKQSIIICINYIIVMMIVVPVRKILFNNRQVFGSQGYTKQDFIKK